MKFILLVCNDPTAEAGSPDDNSVLTIDAWVEEMDGRGVRLQGDPLAPARDATTVKVRKGELLVTDGPYADVKEHVGGFDLLECADLDEAIEVASKHPMARFGALELRAVVDLEG